MSDTNSKIQEQISNNSIVLYMKGSPIFPQCGFSGRAADLLKRCGAKGYFSVDVLQDPEIREGIKAFSSWPTIPQLYVKGEFVGGSDIMMELYESGELKTLIESTNS
ncbi:MAG: Grx4 family monothiol glutaredoxin [Magnetococcales bacterium]|nr:Grx4 family monothiol glutaredoxin [Magnetococcales bacterium]